MQEMCRTAKADPQWCCRVTWARMLILVSHWAFFCCCSTNYQNLTDISSPFKCPVYLCHHFCEKKKLGVYLVMTGYMLFPGEPSSISVMLFLFESLFVFPSVDHCIIFHLLMIPLSYPSFNTQIPTDCLYLLSKCLGFLSSRNLFSYLRCASHPDWLTSMPGA